jgi:PleD family two-component response regulator
MLKTVAVVAPRGCEDALDEVVDAGDYDVVFIESTDGAYSHIRQTLPHLVILVVHDDDPLGLQVLSMLKLDIETSNIPVIARFSRPAAAPVEALEWRSAEPAPGTTLSMN